jgi:allantoin racemase
VQRIDAVIALVSQVLPARLATSSGVPSTRPEIPCEHQGERPVSEPASTRIKMLLPIPMPPQALPAFAAQIPPKLLRPGVSVEFFGTRNGAAILDSQYEGALSDVFVLEVGATAEDEGYAAVCINSMSDSGLNALRSRLTIPVVGPAHSSFHTAAMLGRRFSVVTMWPEWFWMYEKTARETGLKDRLASIRHIGTRPDTAELLAGKEEIVFDKLLRECRAAIDEDGADVLILGSTTMHQSHAWLSERLEVPLLNPGLVAFKLCETLLDLGLSHSKRAYPSPARTADALFASVPSVF